MLSSLFLSHNYSLDLYNGDLQTTTFLFTRYFTQGWLNSYYSWLSSALSCLFIVQHNQSNKLYWSISKYIENYPSKPTIISMKEKGIDKHENAQTTSGRDRVLEKPKTRRLLEDSITLYVLWALCKHCILLRSLLLRSRYLSLSYTWFLIL